MFLVSYSGWGWKYPPWTVWVWGFSLDLLLKEVSNTLMSGSTPVPWLCAVLRAAHLSLDITALPFGDSPCKHCRQLCDPATATSPSQGEVLSSKCWETQLSPQNSSQGNPMSQHVHPSQHFCHPTYPQACLEDNNLWPIANADSTVLCGFSWLPNAAAFPWMQDPWKLEALLVRFSAAETALHWTPWAHQLLDPLVLKYNANTHGKRLEMLVTASQQKRGILESET